jgi:hypothetical protein
MCSKFIVLLIKYTDLRFSPGTSEVLIITNTPKKHPEEVEQRLDPIDSSTRSHQDEGKEVHPACKRRKLQSLGAVIVIKLGKTSKII